MVKADIDSDAASTRSKEVYAKLSRTLGHGLRQDVPLAPHTTFGIGGKADLFFQAATPEDLVFAIRSAQKLKLRFFILGGGSNILVSDSGFRGLVVRNSCQEVVVERNRVTCQSGAVLAEVISSSCQCSLSGLEFAAGIPGTVGGAVRGNAGAFGESIGGVLAQAVVLGESGQIREVGRDFFQFAYRESRLKATGDTLLSATFRLEKRNEEEIAEKIERNRKKRKESLPWQEKSAGCFFKNVIVGERRISAGFLLDKAGAKGMREGGAEVSAKHANIVINSGKASAEDIRRLAQRMNSKVKEKFDIALEEEVVYIN
jgi:UDP-N-acetylmuramate dehydrogenase